MSRPNIFKNNAAERGFVILLVLLFLHIFSLIGLNTLMHEKTKTRAAFNEWQRVNAKLTALNQLGRIEEQLAMNLMNCIISPVSAVVLKQAPLSWWQAKACADKVDEIEYYYVAERLEKDACSVTLIDNTHLVVEYYRITLLVLTLNLKGGRIMLQSTVAKSTDEISLCDGKTQIVSLGRKTQREV